jgi:hypothetical protein
MIKSEQGKQKRTQEEVSVPSRCTILEFASKDEETNKNPQTTWCGNSESNPSAPER